MIACRCCWHWFDRPGTRGPIPKWCSFACRQAAYRRRLTERMAS